MHRDSPIDNRYTSNVIANRLKPLIAYTNPNGTNSPVFENSEHRSPSLVNLPPTSFPQRNGNLMKKDPSDVDHLTKLLMKSMNSSNEANFFGKFLIHFTKKQKILMIFLRYVCKM
jgi:hypothetical protein